MTELNEALLDETHAQANMSKIEQELVIDMTNISLTADARAKCPLYATTITDPIQLATCGYVFCRPCLVEYLQHITSTNRGFPFCVFSLNDDRSTACGYALATEDIEQLLTREEFGKWRVPKIGSKSTLSRPCPHCHCVGEFTIDPVRPECECASCHQHFCYFHGKHHSGGTCGDFELRRVTADKSCRNACPTIQCPECSSSVTRHVGHDGVMTCVVCRHCFCWSCHQDLSGVDAERHFVTDVLADTCRGKAKTRSVMTMCAIIFDVIVCVVPSLIIATVITIVFLFWFPCICFRKATGDDDDDNTISGYFGEVYCAIYDGLNDS